MNIEALNRVAEWLEAGAPEARFHMNYGLSRDPEILQHVEAEPDCGTVCCIAGAAVLLNGGEYTEDWHDIKHQALGILQLPVNGRFAGHDLFDPYLAPEDCTPQQAAAAVRRVMKGEDPWS